MKAILEFDLSKPEQNTEHQQALYANEMRLALLDILSLTEVSTHKLPKTFKARIKTLILARGIPESLIN